MAQSRTEKEERSSCANSFKLMVMYCESATCCHSLFSQYFGDKIPDCNGRCDVCKDASEVKARLKEFLSIGNKSL